MLCKFCNQELQNLIYNVEVETELLATVFIEGLEIGLDGGGY